MNRHRLPGALLGTLLGLILATGCGRTEAKMKVLGKPFAGPATTVLAVRAGDTPPAVVLQGRMVEKCPVAGCWFRLQDGTGIMKVDTKSAGFVVTDIPLGTTVTVAGKVVTMENEASIETTGVRY